MANNTVVYLTRHGQTDWNVEKRNQGRLDVPINDVGKEQAEALRHFFEHIKFDKVFVSPLRRAKQTARIAAPDYDIVFLDDLQERAMGFMQGRKRSEWVKEFPDIAREQEEQGIDWKPPKGGETCRELQKRSIDCFNKIVSENDGRTLLIVTHGGVARSIIHYLHGGRPEDYFHRSRVGNCELIKITWDGLNPVLECLKVHDVKNGWRTT